MLADITDLIPLRAFQDFTLPQFYPRGERIFHVPMCLSTYGLFCNNTLLAKDGFAYPQKLSDFKQICDFYVKKGITPIIANNLGSIPSLVMARSLFPLYRNPLTLKEKKEVLRNEPKMLADTFQPGFQMVEGFLKSGWINGDEAFATRESFGDAAEFQKGERPFMLSQTWCAVELKEKAKNFTFCVAAFPIFESGSVLAIHTDLHLAVNGQSPNLVDAKNLLSFLLRPQNIYRYIVSQVAINPLKNSKLPASPILVPEISCFREGRYVFDIDYELQPNLFEILNSACLLLLKGASPDEARKTLLEKLGTTRA